MSADVLTRLVNAGLSPQEAESKWAAAVTTWEVLRALRDGEPAGEWPGWYVPGRIEVLGKHTDYAGGRSLVGAVERGFVAFAAARSDPVIRIVDAAGGAVATLALAADSEVPVPAWGRYARAVARRIAANFPEISRGADVAFASDLPQASGLASSSALTTTVALAVCWANDLARQERFAHAIRTRIDLARYFAAIESGTEFRTLRGTDGVGTLGGSEDHVAMLTAEAGRLLAYRFDPVRCDARIAVPHSVVFAIAVSGVFAHKTGRARRAYNRAVQLVGELLRLWRQATGRQDRSLGAACRSAPDAVARLTQIVRRARGTAFPRRELLARLEHFVLESETLVPSAVKALQAGHLDGVAAAADRSQEAAERWLRNQVPETTALARLARAGGARAATAFGAGFGGSVWALVDVDRAEAFLEVWRDQYLREHPAQSRRARFFLTTAGPGVLRL